MMIPLLWITAIYALAAMAVHIFHAWRKRKSSPWIHYTLVTSNHEEQIEWYIRALGLYALLTGKRLRLTVLDAASSDQTVGIASRMHGISGMELSVISMKAPMRGEDLEGSLPLDGSLNPSIIDLRNPHEAGRIPYV